MDSSDEVELYDIIMEGTNARAEAHSDIQKKINASIEKFHIRIHSELIIRIEIYRKRCDRRILSVKKSFELEKTRIHRDVDMDEREKKNRMRLVDLQLKKQEVILEQHFNDGKDVFVRQAKIIVRDTNEQLTIKSNYSNRSLETDIASESIRLILIEATEQFDDILQSQSDEYIFFTQEAQQSSRTYLLNLASKEDIYHE